MRTALASWVAGVAATFVVLALLFLEWRLVLLAIPPLVFLMESERNHRHWPALLRYLPTRKGFVAETDRMLAKMEAWR